MYICCNSYVRGLLWKAVFNWNGLPSLKITFKKNFFKVCQSEPSPKSSNFCVAEMFVCVVL